MLARVARSPEITGTSYMPGTVGRNPARSFYFVGRLLHNRSRADAHLRG